MNDPRISNVCGCGRVLGGPLDKDGKCIYCQPKPTRGEVVGGFYSGTFKDYKDAATTLFERWDGDNRP